MSERIINRQDSEQPNRFNVDGESSHFYFTKTDIEVGNAILAEHDLTVDIEVRPITDEDAV